jgi:non-heme chloroperoxidase
MSSMSIARGWTVVSSDSKRVGDVTEVHPHYLLVSRGVFRVKDMYLPLGTVDRTEGETVILTVTFDVLKSMDLSREPPPIVNPEPEPLHDPVSQGYETSEYPSETDTSDEPLAFPGDWASEDTEFEETPSYARPLPNGLIEVEHALNLAFQDLGYGLPILLLQGWPFDSAVWEPLPTILADEHRVITYDMRGSGDSDKPWDYYSIDTLVHDLHRIVVEQSLRGMTLVAWSTAAPLALEYAREHPKRVERIVLLSPLLLNWLAAEDAPTWIGHSPELDRATQEAWAADLLADRPALFERIVDRITHAPLSSARRQWLWQRLMLGAPYAQGKLFQALQTYDPTGLLAEIETPVTIISGEQDRLSPPALSARLADMLPRAQVVTVGDCGHASFIEQRSVIFQAISDLVDAHIEQANENEATIDTEPVDGAIPDHESELVSTEAEQSLLLDE